VPKLPVFGSDLVATVAIFGFVIRTVIVELEVVMLLAAFVEDTHFTDIAAGMIAVKMVAHIRGQIVNSDHGDLVIVVVAMMVMMRAATKKAEGDGQRQEG
jgi:hypothetical protein